MDVLREFDIEFIKLKEGEHHFEYQITEPFFKAFGSSLTAQDMTVRLTFSRSATMFTLVFDLSGKVELDCDRCLTRIALPVKGHHTVVVKVSEFERESEDDLIYITPHEHKINIAQHVYDFINLSLPIKRTCSDIGQVCDPSIAGKISSMIDVEMAENDLPERDTDEEDNEE